MNPDVKTFMSFWMPIRLLKELETKRGKLSRDQLAVLLIEKGLRDDETVKEVKALYQVQEKKQKERQQQAKQWNKEQKKQHRVTVLDAALQKK